MKIASLFAIAIVFTLTTSAQKDVSKWLKDVEINGRNLKILRIPKEDLLANFKGVIANDAWGYQKLLDTARNRYLARRTMRQEGPAFAIYDQFIEVQAPDFPLNYYRDELVAYQVWSKQLEAELEAHREDSFRTLALQKGFLWINTPSVAVKAEPNAKSMTMGTLTRLSYVTAYEVDGVWAELEFGNFKGYVLKSDLADNWDDMELTEEERTKLKKGRYYNFEESAVYTAKLKKEEAEDERAYQAANKAPKRKYILGPRGGCYYINSNGNKQYVDRSYCR